MLLGGVETKDLDRSCKTVIDTQFEKGMLIPRVLVRYSPLYFNNIRREICDVVFKARTEMKIGNKTFKKGQPVLYIDTAKTSTLEGTAATVYAQGGKGNPRLVAWEGERTVTFEPMTAKVAA